MSRFKNVASRAASGLVNAYMPTTVGAGDVMEFVVPAPAPAPNRAHSGLRTTSPDPALDRRSARARAVADDTVTQVHRALGMTYADRRHAPIRHAPA